MIKEKDKVKKYINIAKGQLEGINRMIDEGRYCLDISDQLAATIALIKKANNTVLKNHIESCVKESIENGESAKVDELLKSLERQI